MEGPCRATPTKPETRLNKEIIANALLSVSANNGLTNRNKSALPCIYIQFPNQKTTLCSSKRYLQVGLQQIDCDEAEQITVKMAANYDRRITRDSITYKTDLTDCLIQNTVTNQCFHRVT